MEKHHLRNIWICSVVITGIIISIMLLIRINFSTFEGLAKLTIIFTALGLFWPFYFRCGWKWTVLKLIAYKENLNGTWFGKYKSKDINGNIFEGEICIIIRQDFLNMYIASHTENYDSFSYGESILKNSKHNYYELAYLYSQNELDLTDNLARKGASELRLVLEKKEKKLIGKFWTNHNSHGNLDLKFIDCKQYTSFADAKDSLNNSK